LLIDPSWDFIIFSPSPGMTEQEWRPDGSALIHRVEDAIAGKENTNFSNKIEVVPRETLERALNSIRLNATDLVPGGGLTDETMKAAEMVREGDFELLLAGISDQESSPALKAALRFEAGIDRNRSAQGSPEAAEDAIRYFVGSLDFYTRKDFPYRWAAVHAEMISAFAYRGRGDPTDNIREALRCADVALEVFDIDTYPEDFALTQSARANALLEQKKDRLKSIELGIEAYRQALRVYTPQSYASDWALTLSNFATALLERGSQGDIENAVDALQKALSVRQKDSSPYEWALTMMNLGLALGRLQSEDSASHYEAIKALRAAHEVLASAGSSQSLAVKYNLGLALAKSASAEEFTEAASLLEEARIQLQERGDLLQLEFCTERLADLYLRWASDAADLRVEICARALTNFVGERDSETVGVLLHEVGRFLVASHENTQTSMALKAAKQALCILRTKPQAEYRAKALTNLGLIFLRREAKPRATSCFNAAMEIFAKLEPSPERVEAMGSLHIYLEMASGRRGPAST
jgi:tetratricopeptide (TPR) repeat protein